MVELFTILFVIEVTVTVLLCTLSIAVANAFTESVPRTTADTVTVFPYNLAIAENKSFTSGVPFTVAVTSTLLLLTFLMESAKACT